MHFASCCALCSAKPLCVAYNVNNQTGRDSCFLRSTYKADAYAPGSPCGERCIGHVLEPGIHCCVMPSLKGGDVKGDFREGFFERPISYVPYATGARGMPPCEAPVGAGKNSMSAPPRGSATRRRDRLAGRAAGTSRSFRPKSIAKLKHVSMHAIWRDLHL